ncbi:MAG: FAD-dependent oxidoreductase, partial [Dehalococcoidia bacterium]|nr:FAD-dependent oxidoreductase [Dehalococcoidia bacterium]
WAVPSFRLPRNVLNRDIEYIEKMGIVIKTGVKLGVDVSLSDLKKDGADAVIMAIGTQQGLKPRIENDEHSMRYTDCLTFLRKYANGERVDLGDKVVIIGGGNAGIDCARSALRCGAKEVTMIDILDYEEIAADGDETKEAQAEGVKTNYLTMPTRIINKDGEIQALECVKTKLSEPDELGRRNPLPIRGSEFIINATSIISATGQRPDLSWNREGLPFNLSPTNTFITDDNCLTNVEGVFAAGDAVNGPTKIIEAMANGKRVARFVDLYLSNKG